MDINTGFVPLISYQLVRIPSETDENWLDRRNLNNEYDSGGNHAIAVKFRTEDGAQRVAYGGFHWQRARDFCGGIYLSSGFARTGPLIHNMDHRYRVYNSVPEGDTDDMVCLNDLCGEESITLQQAKRFVKRSVALGVLTLARSARRGMVIWADKRGGTMSGIMEMLEDGEHEFYDVPAWFQGPAIDPAATLRTRMPVQMVTGTVTTTKSVDGHNWNSGNTVNGYITNIVWADPDDTTQCNNCGTDNDEGAEYCCECDHALRRGTPDLVVDFEAPPAWFSQYRSANTLLRIPFTSWKNG